MAKPATLQIKLVSSADTGYFYVTKKNPRTKPEKLELKKYDPRARKHVIFRESKIREFPRFGLSKMLRTREICVLCITCRPFGETRITWVSTLTLPSAP